MSKGSDLLQFMKPGLLGRWIAERYDIWQMEFLDERELSRFARERGLRFWDNHIRQLWQLKLVRADLVASRRKLHLAGLIDVGMDDMGQHLYADERRVRRRMKGWGSAAATLRPLPRWVKLYFHRFRYYVLYRLEKRLELGIHPMQTLVNMEGYPRLLDRALSHFQRFSADSTFIQNVRSWNDVVALAVATEPCFYTRLFGILQRPPGVGWAIQVLRIEEHWQELAKCYQDIGVQEVERARRDLCISAELLHPNKDVHTILRLAQGKFRMSIRGRLGGALLLLTMAEMLRRATERAFDVHLPEEDELGFGVTLPGGKQELYGSDRVLDGRRTVANEFLRQFGLDYSVRVRWYCEGDTEYGALSWRLAGFRSIELINLKGAVAERGRKALSFVDSLDRDLDAQVFSFVLLDRDNDHYVRLVRKAATDDRICGRFFISEPDFEFANFTLPELEEILWDVAVEQGAGPDARQVLHEAIVGLHSSTELEKAWQSAVPELRQFGKGEAWGERLMRYASKFKRMRDERTGTLTTRPIVQAVQAALQFAGANYRATRTQLQVDARTGEAVKREAE